MSVESVVDLRADASPRSLSVFAAAETQVSVGSTNPFDVAKGPTDRGNTIALVYGTDRGSVHYRTYAAPNPSSTRGGLSAQLNLISSVTTSPSNRTSFPLGANSSGQRASNLPRTYYPVDLGSLAGPVVSCIKLGHSHSNSTYFLLLVDDNRGTSAAQPGAYAAVIVALTAGNFNVIVPSGNLPRISCATFHPLTGLVYGAGRSIQLLGPETWEEEVKRGSRYNLSRSKRLFFGQNILPAPGVRTGQDAIELTANGKVLIAVVGNTFHAVVGQEADERQQGGDQETSESIKVLSFSQSSQVHPVIALDLRDESLDDDWSSLFLASGRECAVVDLNYGPPSAPTLSVSKPRNGIVTLASPILAAAASWPWIAVLTSDGLVSIRPPSCLSITLRTVEVGQRPNDFFVMRTLRNANETAPWIVALAYSGESKILQCQPDTAQDLADRLMRHAIDAFGKDEFPRAEVAESVGASVTAASYVGPEPSQHARILLKQYLEALLGMTDFEGNPNSGWPSDLGAGASHHGSFGGDKRIGTFYGRGSRSSMLSADSPGHLMTASALLCLVCSKISPPNPALANRAAKLCAEKLGVVFLERGDVPNSTVQVCGLVAEKILREATNNFSLLSGSTSASPLHRGSNALNNASFVEASVWLLRSAGKHEQAIEVAYTRLLHQGQQLQPENEMSSTGGRGTWSQIKYESYTATHLSEIWCSGKSEGYELVLRSPATFRLLENNPRLGLSVFTASHPHHEEQWRELSAKDDPLAHSGYVYEVLKLLKSVNPSLPYDRERFGVDCALPLESGRALAVAFLESAIGINSGRPSEGDEFNSLPVDDESKDHIANFHDELSFLLLEGVIAEKSDDGAEERDTSLGEIYREKLRKLLKWPLTRIRPDRFLSTLPPSFLHEKALMLGRIGRHEDALRILYHDLDSLEFALEYCDDRFEQQRLQRDRRNQLQQRATGIDQSFELSALVSSDDNAYIPLVRVALDSKDQERGIRTAIQILALRRGAIDRAAALRMLPAGIPVSAVARPFLIPALVDSASQERRLTMVSALMRARYLRLKEELTVAQLRSQASLQVVPQLRGLNLGEPLYSSKAFRARTNATASSTMPDVMIIKHFFPINVVIQAKVTNNTGGESSDYRLSTHGRVGRTYTDIAFVVAESSEEAIQPLLLVPIKVLPQKLSGSAWCVLEAAPARMDGAVAQLTCELRYTIQSVESPSLVGSPSASGVGRTYVEELQDLEVHASHFS